MPTKSDAKPPAPSWPLSEGDTSPPKTTTAGPDTGAKLNDAHTERGRSHSDGARSHTRRATSKRTTSFVSCPAKPATASSAEPSAAASRVAPPRPGYPPKSAGGASSVHRRLLRSNSWRSARLPEASQPPKTYTRSPTAAARWKERALGGSPLAASSGVHATASGSKDQRSLRSPSPMLTLVRPPNTINWPLAAHCACPMRGSGAALPLGCSSVHAPACKSSLCTTLSMAVRAVASPPKR
mmetsp:Transcript_2312/g.8048  ORF Transcript_2312/g.8048 Transcript_2312/m.8048 type:complete len:240 (+) Transcript_2312:515-1234(+)